MNIEIIIEGPIWLLYHKRIKNHFGHKDFSSKQQEGCHAREKNGLYLLIILIRMWREKKIVLYFLSRIFVGGKLLTNDNILDLWVDVNLQTEVMTDETGLFSKFYIGIREKLYSNFLVSQNILSVYRIQFHSSMKPFPLSGWREDSIFREIQDNKFFVKLIPLLLLMTNWIRYWRSSLIALAHIFKILYTYSFLKKLLHTYKINLYFFSQKL